MTSRPPRLLLIAALLLGLPIAGAFVGGQPILQYLEFPPLTRYRVPAAFSWPAFLGLAAFEVLLYLPVAALLRAIAGHRPPATARFPTWGIGAALWLVIWWALAWTRLPVLGDLQSHTFTGLWLGYIGVVNAWTFARSGRCMLTHRPRYAAALFAASAAFWWFFEYLNRFVQNWVYEGVEHFGPLRYFLFATLPFSTVLPAVLGTADLLETFTPPHALTRCPVRLPPATRGGAWALLVIAAAGLAGIGLWPDRLYPLVWMAPFFLLVAMRQLRGEPTALSPAASGDWRRVAILMTAALVCGFFWEMWNYSSLARWVYLVPYVGRFHLFEMPALGYAGYLPFGLECAVIADALLPQRDPAAPRTSQPGSCITAEAQRTPREAPTGQ